MNDQDWAKRFNADVDHLFKTGTLAHSDERTPAEYAGLLTLAQTLSSTDFSDASQKRRGFQRRLQAKLEARERRRVGKRISLFTLFQKRRFAPVLSALVLAGLLVTGLAWPGGLTAAAQSAVAFVQRLWIGEHTSIEPTDPKWAFPKACRVVLLDPMMQGADVKQCEVVEVHAVCGSGETVAIHGRQPGAVAEAQAILPFALRQPGYLPQGYSFGEAKVWSGGDVTAVDLHYGGPGGWVTLSQRSVGGQSGQTVSFGLPHVSVVETVQVNGHSAAWAEHTLLWEAGDVSFLLTGSDLSLAEALRIAASLE